MKKLLIFIATLALIFSGASSAGASILFVQNASSSVSASASSGIQVVLSGVTAGNTVLVDCSTYNTTTADGSIVSVTDNKSNTYAKDFATLNAGVQNQGLGLFRATNISLGGTLQITCNYTRNDVTYRNISANEYSGLSNASTTVIDATSTAASTIANATINPGTITTTNANDLIFSIAVNNAGGVGAMLAAPNYNKRNDGSGAGEMWGDLDRVVSATGSYVASSSGWGNGGQWIGFQESLKAPATAANAFSQLYLGSGNLNFGNGIIQF